MSKKKKHDYVPAKNGDKAPWAANMKVKIATVGPTVGESAGDITTVEDAAQGVIDEVNNIKNAKSTFKTAVQNASTNIGDHVKVIRNHANSIKANGGYSDAKGKDLGIVGEEDTFDPSIWKTVLTFLLFTDHVQINFIKDQTDGVNIYSRLKGATTWTLLAFDTHSPYNDSRPLAVPGTPEVREYMAIGVMDDLQLPTESDVIAVTVK